MTIWSRNKCEWYIEIIWDVRNVQKRCLVQTVNERRGGGCLQDNWRNQRRFRASKLGETSSAIMSGVCFFQEKKNKLIKLKSVPNGILNCSWCWQSSSHSSGVVGQTQVYCRTVTGDRERRSARVLGVVGGGPGRGVLAKWARREIVIKKLPRPPAKRMNILYAI